MVNLAQQVEHRSVDSKDLVQVQSFTLLLYGHSNSYY